MGDCKIKIGVVSTQISEKDALKPVTNDYEGPTLDQKKRLFKILNTAKIEHAQYLSFPEFYLPILWLPEVCNFCKLNNIAVITGLHYIIKDNIAHNYTCVIEPITIFRFYQCAIPFFREKIIMHLKKKST